MEYADWALLFFAITLGISLIGVAIVGIYFIIHHKKEREK